MALVFLCTTQTLLEKTNSVASSRLPGQRPPLGLLRKSRFLFVVDPSLLPSLCNTQTLLQKTNSIATAWSPGYLSACSARASFRSLWILVDPIRYLSVPISLSISIVHTLAMVETMMEYTAAAMVALKVIYRVECFKEWRGVCQS